MLDTEVRNLRKSPDGYITVQTNHGELRTKVVINAAGLNAHHIMHMAGEDWFSIHPAVVSILSWTRMWVTSCAM